MDKELEKFQDLLTSQSLTTCSPPPPNQMISYDITSLYPSIQKKYYYRINMKISIRKRKIRNIFKNPS